MRGGVGRTDITPPVPADLVGYVRRWRPALEVRSPLTATALVLDSGAERVAILGIDLAIIRPDFATMVREQVAEAISTRPEAVLLNVSHTHAGPHTSGRLKMGGRLEEISPAEQLYFEHLPYQLVSAARLAAESLTPVRVGSASAEVKGLSVNRRERVQGVQGTTGALNTILGWNPDGPIDRDVGVIRVDREDGSPLAVVVSFGCHPVVVGPEDPAINPDFPGPLREAVEKATGARCLFLQGAGGNILPLQAFIPETGPERVFGEKLATEALHELSNIETYQTRIERFSYGSVTPIALYRVVRAETQPLQELAVASTVVDLPLKRVPTIAEVQAERDHHQKNLEKARREGAGLEALNPIQYHISWADDAIAQLKEGPYDRVPAFIQAIRIGDTAIVAIPGEAFAEISLAIRERSPAGRANTIFSGYSNGVISYLPSAAEYPHGGYEVDYAHHSYGLIEQVAPESEAILVEAGVEMLKELW